MFERILIVYDGGWFKHNDTLVRYDVKMLTSTLITIAFVIAQHWMLVEISIRLEWLKTLIYQFNHIFFWYNFALYGNTRRDFVQNRAVLTTRCDNTFSEVMKKC